MFDREDREVRERKCKEYGKKGRNIYIYIYVFIIEFVMRDRKVERKKGFCIESILVYYRNMIFKSLHIEKDCQLNHVILFSSHFGEIKNDGPG